MNNTAHRAKPRRGRCTIHCSSSEAEMSEVEMRSVSTSAPLGVQIMLIERSRDERGRDERSRDALGVQDQCAQSPQYTPLSHHSKPSQKSTMQTSPIKPVFWQLLFYSSFVSLSPICQFSIFHMIHGIIVIP